jgi:hypothetical protein
MNKFEQLTKCFGEAREKGTAAISTIKAKKIALECNLSEAKAEWQLALIKEIEGEKVDLTKSQKQMRAIENEIALTEELVQAAELRLHSQLVEIIPALEVARNASHEQTWDDVSEQTKNLKVKRCEFIIACQHIGMTAAKSYDTENLFLSMILEAYGTQSSYKPSRRVGIPAINLYSQYESISNHCAPSEHEVRVALGTGGIPAFVRWYAKTGELISNNDAHKRLEELKRLEES